MAFGVTNTTPEWRTEHKNKSQKHSQQSLYLEALPKSREEIKQLHQHNHPKFFWLRGKDNQFSQTKKITKPTKRAFGSKTLLSHEYSRVLTSLHPPLPGILRCITLPLFLSVFRKAFRHFCGDYGSESVQVWCWLGVGSKFLTLRIRFPFEHFWWLRRKNNGMTPVKPLSLSTLRITMFSVVGLAIAEMMIPKFVFKPQSIFYLLQQRGIRTVVSYPPSTAQFQ